jgi:hypothetical protein
MRVRLLAIWWVGVSGAMDWGRWISDGLRMGLIGFLLLTFPYWLPLINFLLISFLLIGFH